AGDDADQRLADVEVVLLAAQLLAELGDDLGDRGQRVEAQPGAHIVDGEQLPQSDGGEHGDHPDQAGPPQRGPRRPGRAGLGRGGLGGGGLGGGGLGGGGLERGGRVGGGLGSRDRFHGRGGRPGGGFGDGTHGRTSAIACS